MIHALIAAVALLPGQVNTLHDGTVCVATPTQTVEVQPLDDNIFRVTTQPLGAKLDYAPSQSVVMQPDAAVSATTFTTPQWVKIITPSTVVTVNRLTGRVAFADATGRPLLTESAGVDNAGDIKRVSFAGNDVGNLYGAGERGRRLALNGDTLVMYNRQNYGYGEGDPRLAQMGITVPWFVSDKGCGVLFDDYNRATLALGNDSIVYTSDTQKPLSYYFVNSTEGDLAGVTSGYTALTGRQPLAPFWSLGYITSKYGYHNQAEALGAVDSLKQRDYPLDGIVLDLYWYGVETDMGRLQWDTVQWPDHRAMLRQLRDSGVNLVAISQPYVNKIGAIDNYNYLSERSMLAMDADGNTHDLTTWVGDAGLLDVSNDSTRRWLADRYRQLTADGIEGWWGDLGDLEVHPETMIHKNGETASQYHNVYGNEWSRIIYEMLRRDYPDRRPYLLMRGGTAGLQRYAVFPWSTDVARSWQGLQPQIKLMLNSGLSGLGYMSSDIGGFAVDPANPTDPELYVRWLQMGAFTPTLRTHAQLKPEPYHYPGMENILHRYIRMRYEWLPYNYTLAYENARYGWPAVRPLNFRGDNPAPEYTQVADEYLWGDDVLVAPVMTRGTRSRKVLFPAGSWYDWWNPALRYNGGTTVSVKALLDRLPLFVRAGSFIPQYPDKIDNVGEFDPAKVTVIYFPSDKPSTGLLFMDDRQSPTSLEDNDFQLTEFAADGGASLLAIDIKSSGEYKGMPDLRHLTLEIPAYGPKQPKSVKVIVDGRESTPAEVSLKSQRLIIRTELTQSPTQILIQR